MQLLDHVSIAVPDHTVGIMTWTKSPEAAAALIRYLTANEGRAMFLSKGFTAPR